MGRKERARWTASSPSFRFHPYIIVATLLALCPPLAPEPARNQKIKKKRVHSTCGAKSINLERCGWGCARTKKGVMFPRGVEGMDEAVRKGDEKREGSGGGMEGKRDARGWKREKIENKKYGQVKLGRGESIRGEDKNGEREESRAQTTTPSKREDEQPNKLRRKYRRGTKTGVAEWSCFQFGETAMVEIGG